MTDGSGEDSNDEDERPIALFESPPLAELERMVEAILFASAEPLTRPQIEDRLPHGSDASHALEALRKRYEGRGVHLVRVDQDDVSRIELLKLAADVARLGPPDLGRDQVLVVKVRVERQRAVSPPCVIEGETWSAVERGMQIQACHGHKVRGQAPRGRPRDSRLLPCALSVVWDALSSVAICGQER